MYEQRLSFMIYGKNSENIRLKMFFSCLSNFLKSLEYLEIRDWGNLYRRQQTKLPVLLFPHGSQVDTSRSQYIGPYQGNSEFKWRCQKLFYCSLEEAKGNNWAFSKSSILGSLSKFKYITCAFPTYYGTNITDKETIVTTLHREMGQDPRPKCFLCKHHKE
jgi:hypothetical protein